MSTPINQLRGRVSDNLSNTPSLLGNSTGNIGNPLGSSSDSKLVEDILRDMGSNVVGSDNIANINAESFNHVMDGNSQIPPEHINAPPPSVDPRLVHSTQETINNETNKTNNSSYSNHSIL